jgi:hypothetical protein
VLSVLVGGLEDAVTRLVDLATVIRSKNAGPYLLTFDVLLRDRDAYRRVMGSEAFTRSRIAALFDVPPEDVLEVVGFEPANAIRTTPDQPVVFGSLSDTDVYGAQQHIPLLGLEVRGGVRC